MTYGQRSPSPPQSFSLSLFSVTSVRGPAALLGAMLLLACYPESSSMGSAFGSLGSVQFLMALE